MIAPRDSTLQHLAAALAALAMSSPASAAVGPLTSDLLHAQAPDLVPAPGRMADGPGHVVSLARDGMFREAWSALERLERSTLDGAILHVTDTVRSRVGAVEGEVVGGGTVIHGELGRLQAAQQSRLADVAARQARLLQEVGPGNQGDVMAAFTVGSAFTMCEAARALAPVLQALKASGGQPPAPSPADVCLMLLDQLDALTGDAADVPLVRALLLGRLAAVERVAGRDPGIAAADVHLQQGVDVARRSSRPCAAAALLVEMGDLRVTSSGGAVETLGMRISTEEVVRNELRFGAVPDAIAPPTQAAIADGVRLYAAARRERVSCGGPADVGLALRDAYVSFLKGEAGAASAYDRAAELAAEEGRDRVASFARLATAVVRANTAGMRDVIAGLAARGDVGGAVTAGEELRSVAARRLRLGGDVSGALAVLDTAARALGAAGLHAAAAEAWVDAADIQATSGRTELAVAEQRRASDAFERFLARGSAAGEEPKIINLLVSLDSNLGLLALQTPRGPWKDRRADVAPRLARWRGHEFFEMAKHLVDGQVRISEFHIALAQAVAVRACDERLVALRALRGQAQELAASVHNHSAEIQLALVEGGCDPEGMKAARRLLAAEDPAARLRTARAAAAGLGRAQAQLELNGAIAAVQLVVDQVIAAGDDERAARWLQALSPLVREDRAFAVLGPQLEATRALLDLGRGDRASARRRVGELLAAPHGADARTLAVRTALLGLLSEASDGDDALVAYERQRDAEVRWEDAQAGRSAAVPATLELNALEWQLASTGQLSPGSEARVSALQAQVLASRGTPPSRNPTLAEIRALRQKLPLDLVVLVYQVDARGARAWRFSRVDAPRQVTLARADVDELMREVRGLVDALASRRDDGGLRRRMYQRLVGPMGAIPERAPLAIVATGELRRLPFASLVTQCGRQLGDGHAIFYPLRLLDDDPQSGASTASSATVFGTNVVNLAYAEDEAAAVATTIGVPRIDAAADADAVLAASREAGVVHLAADATVFAGDPYASYLSLKNGKLEAWRLASAVHRANLVVLSACRTAAEPLPPPGVTQPPRGSFAALLHGSGVRWVVASQWRVDDSGTARLMASFYAELGRGMSLPRALQAAQAAVATSEAEPAPPFVWAPFLLSARSLESAVGASGVPWSTVMEERP